ncbi:MAG: right-handed parallel beta-helix repeat-containing protein [Actinomycetia bacterium]|nr:right-handed parallel beta-helix repeat-containing protein [Actinomycetes bacterium]
MRKHALYLPAVILAVALVALTIPPVAGEADAAGSTYYVSPQGDNSYAGSLELPWADPGYASRQIGSGDTLVILGGTYHLNQYDADIISPPSGTSGAWTTVKGELGNRPVLAGGGNLIFAIDLSGRSYVSIENLEITSDGGKPFREAVNATAGPLNRCLLTDLYIHHVDEFGVNIGDTRYLEITDCVIEYCGFGSVGGPDGVQGGWRDVTISGCDLSYNGHYSQGGPGPTPYSRPDGFGIEESSGPIEIASTVVEHNRGDGLDSKASNTYIHSCVVANNSCDGVKLWGGGSRVENTLIYGMGDGVKGASPWAGLVISDGDNPGARFEVVNVTVHDNPEREAYPMYVQYDYDAPIQVLMRNNIIANGYDLAFFGDSVTLIAEHNVFYRPGGQAQVYANGREYSAADIDGGVLGEGNVCADPIFESPAWGSGGDYHLCESSPAIDSGTGKGAPGTDLDGRARPAGDGYDIGAYEFEEMGASFLAEGSTAWGFDCYVTIETPNSTAVTASIGYMTDSGLVNGGEVNLPANSQTTVNPRDTVGDQDFSTQVECKEGKTIAVDRTMTWTGEGAPSPDGHCSIGVTSPATTWYLAEGSSAWGFECWLLIQNPNQTEATATVTCMIEGDTPQVFEKKIPANSRKTYNMADDIGAVDASIKVTSDLPVIPERAMYRNNRREGHDSIGTTAAATDYYLAEGTTAWGFTTYVLVQNPNTTDTNVTITYMTSSGPVPQAPFTMPGKSRKTIRVNDVLPATDFSTQVTGSQAIIAERAMYWGEGTEAGEACHDSIGLSAPHTTFYLPDGQTSEGRETYTLVMNPNDTDVTVEVTYLTPDGTGNVVFEETVSANSRKTFSMVDKGISGRAAVMVTCKTSGKKIVVERAMYWNSRGAGTDTIGGFSD